LASQIALIESNLSIANMSFGEFIDLLDDHGVFNGFPA